MQKRIVICCDGTWRGLDSICPTNSVALAKAVLPLDPRTETAQITFHLDGVGTGRGTGRLAKLSDRLFGGLLGSGLTETIAEAYRLLMFTYRPGDQIYIFGFSRGAYTARSLAGMIRNCGILDRAHAGRLGEALALYRSMDADSHPDGPRSLAFRAAYAPDVVTGETERAWRERERPGRDWSGAVPLRICYIGVWDTVGSLGVPPSLSLAGLLNRRHRFHDTCLSSRVGAARHAVAIDERRRSFLPALWDNVDDLNRTAGAEPDLPDAPYQQRWFPGVHTAIGGGTDDRCLAVGALLWVMEGARRQGLAFDPEAEAQLAQTADPFGPLSASLRSRWLRMLNPLRLMPVDRDGPARAHEIAHETRLRWSGDSRYRPRPLDKVRPVLDRPDLSEGASAREVWAAQA